MSIVEIIEDRIRRYLAGEDIGPASGITYGDPRSGIVPPSEEEIARLVAAINRERE